MLSPDKLLFVLFLVFSLSLRVGLRTKFHDYFVEVGPRRTNAVDQTLLKTEKSCCFGTDYVCDIILYICLLFIYNI